MSDLVPSNGNGALLSPLGAGGGASFKDRARAFVAQPGVRKALPWFAGLASVGLLALVWAGLSPAPQRVLYGSLGDAERAGVVSALDGVNATQATASALSDAYERGETTDIAKVMLARQEAGVAFEATLQVRNKLLSAYQEIMRMGV